MREFIAAVWSAPSHIGHYARVRATNRAEARRLVFKYAQLCEDRDPANRYEVEYVLPAIDGRISKQMERETAKWRRR